ncbi:hypothetical protein DFQ11_101945 [Winogradskyella epiphytica]|uniref:Uncharacterized protein n=1 Tax=Winogradskyella epiphytica TaxID=262005 RepID=A0A2V4X1F6_9FLAO|nr:hypothetical protein [Winogradskyella epiphytica]PYE83508.1 hypothetical protein DFQ11_101945 [Winogradskyella epiphytica]GGW58675.1 hypothetical protein GCM10008085_08010 [Winogradskyella epiphytica]
MKIFTLILSIIAVALVIFNATKLNFDALFEGESHTAIITIVAACCALVLLQILRLSKKIEKLHKQRK